MATGRTMHAAFFDAIRSMTVRETPVPEPGQGEVRIRVAFCGICGSDLTLYKTGAGSGPNVILGHEVSGVVDLDPSGEWAEGTRIVSYPAGRGCGACVWCREGQARYCMNPPADVGAGHGGGFAEFMVVPATSLILVPDEVDDRTAALAEPLGVVLRGLSMAEPRPGDLAYVQGLGPIGLLTVGALAAAGCRVIGSDPREDRRAHGRAQGAEHVFDPTRQDPFATVMAFDPRGPRVAFECSGAPGALQQVLDACGPAGVVGILGVPMASVSLMRMTLKDLRAFSIQGPTMGTMRLALTTLTRSSHVAEVVTGTVALFRTNGAFAALTDGGGGAKVLVQPTN